MPGIEIVKLPFCHFAGMDIFHTFAAKKCKNN